MASRSTRDAIKSSAVGPGVAVVMQNNTLQWVDREGKIMRFGGQVDLGHNPGACSVGDWLVVGTGHGVKTEPITDLLGNVVEGSDNQPTV